MAAVQLSRRFRPLLVALGLAGALLLSATEEARAVGLMAAGEKKAIEQRLALSVGPGRVSLWSQVRVDGPGGEIAIVLPVTDGTAIDWGSRAFFESLQAASAPRVIPPDGAPAVCPGDDPETLVEVVGDVAGGATLEPVETLVLDDLPAVEAWATSHGLTISSGLNVALQTAGSARFFVARFAAPNGPALTKALRVVVPGGTPTIPLVLSQASTQPVDVVLWSVGPGRADIEGTPALVDTSDLVFDVGAVSSNYRDLLSSALSTPASVVYQMASHEGLRDTIPVAEGGPTIESVIRTYFERAAQLGEVVGDPDVCVTSAAVVLGQSTRLGTTCPRSQLGVAGGVAPCTADTIDGGEVDPALLRCGPVADDVAILLSDQIPKDAWLTRAAARIPVGQFGADKTVTFATGDRLDPIVSSTSIDLSGCGGNGQGGMPGSGSTGAGDTSGVGPSAGSGTQTFVEVPVYVYDGCACGGEYIIVDYESVDSEEAPDGYYVDEGDGCSSETADTYVDDDYSTDAPDDCSGETYDGSDSAVDDGCGCDTSDAESIDAEGCSCDAPESGADSCDCGEGIDATGDGCGDDCATKPLRKPRRLNRYVYILLGILIPLRRASRPKRNRS